MATTASWSARSAGLAKPTVPPAARISAATSLQGLGLDVGQVELGAAARGGQRRRPTDAAGGAGDQAALVRAGPSPQARPGGKLGLDVERVQGHRQHLVVADQHAELDQLDLVELGRQPAPELVADLAARACSSSAAPSSSAGAATSPGRSAPSRTRAISSSLSPARRPIRSWWLHSYSLPVLWATRRITSSVSSRGSLPPGISAPANQSQRRKRPRWRASVVKMCGGRPPVASPATLAIAGVDQADLAAAPGAMRGLRLLPSLGDRNASPLGVPAALGCAHGLAAARRRHALDAVPRLLRAAGHRSSGRTGKPVNALLGTANLILREVEIHEPRAVVLCFGPDAASYRTELYPAYHAEREAAMPDELAPQFAACRDFFEAFGWTVATSEDLEADDLLGTYARREAEAGGRALLLTGDRDMYQCAGERVTVLYVRTGAKAPKRSTPGRRCGSATGSTPSWSPTSSPCAATPPTACPAPRASAQKTAAELLRSHGSLEAVLDNAIREQRPEAARRPDRRRARSCSPSRTSRPCATPGSSRPPDRPTDWAGAGGGGPRARHEPPRRAADRDGRNEA